MTESIIKRETVTTSPSARAALRVIKSAPELSRVVIETWEQNFDRVWHNRQATPEEVLAELGTDAVEVFELSTEIAIFINALLTGRDEEERERLMAKVAVLPTTTSHEDGTVTIDPAVE